MTVDVLPANAAAVGGLMGVFWLLSLPLRNVAIVDVAWGLGFVVISWTTYASAGATSVWLPVLVTIWGLRLAVHLGNRNLGHEEDRRYASMRRSWPVFPLTSLFIVFGLQGVIQLVVGLPLMSGIAATETEPSNVLRVLGTVVWSIGFLFEAVGDWQLGRFKADPENAGRVMDRGLWRYTRHPNYFGDCLLWWGLFVVAVGEGAAWCTVVGPAGMTWLLLRVSGVTLLERGMSERRPGYADYVRRTSSFIPWPPKPGPSEGEPS